jgi:TonB-linked SusC/RagA family outer membrane protein
MSLTALFTPPVGVPANDWHKTKTQKMVVGVESPESCTQRLQADHQQRQILRVMTLSRFAAKSHRSINKTVRLAMKLTAIILLTACLSASARGYSQRVSISAKNASLKTVFAAIEKQAGYTFMYTEDILQKASKVTVNIKDASVEEALATCFKDQPLTYTIVEKVIIVKEKVPNGSGVTEDVSLSGVEDRHPPIDISGKVTDADGNPLSGATVKVKGTSKGTTTNNDGVFVLKGVDDNAVLEISFVGYETYTVGVANKSTIVASLKVKPESLNEIIINKGYYTEKQRLTVGNVGQVTSKIIEKQPVTNVLSAMQGRVPGLFISQSNGLPGSGISVQIQGQNSIVWGTDPLYVIDGVQFPSQRLATNISSVLGYGVNPSLSAQAGSPLSFINPNDIESVVILKDADATSIYGSRAANGAILITTKKGKSGKTRFDVNVQNGWGKLTRHVEMLNTGQYIQMRREGLRNDNSAITAADYDINGTWDTTRYTDWQKELLGGTAQFSDEQFTVSGGSPTAQYLLGGDYHRETTVFPGDFKYTKGSFHAQFSTISQNQKFHLQFIGNYVADKNFLPSNDYTDFAIYDALAPNAPALRNPDGSLNWAPNPSTGQTTWSGSYLYTPLANGLKSVMIRTTNLISNAVLSYQITPLLEMKINAGYNKLDTKENSKNPLTSIDPYLWISRGNDGRSANYANSSIATWLIEPQMNFKKAIAKGNLDVLIGTTFQQQQSDGVTMTARTYVSDLLLEDVKSASTVTVTNSIASLYKYDAFFGRLNYNWDNKYILNISGRRDGSSRFGPKSRFHTFASVGSSWIFSKENFIAENLKFLSFGKVRASYGTTGSDQIPDYLYLNLYPTNVVQVPYQGVNGLAGNRLTNPYLQWEETKKLQAGIDLGFFHDRLNVTVNFYRNRSSNQLLGYSLPYVAGYSSIQENLPATIQNSGWEIAIIGQPVKIRQFQWTSNFNVTIPRNKLVSFPDIQNTSYSTYLKQGDPFVVSATYRYMGTNPTTGLYLFSDKDGNPVTSGAYGSATTVNLAPRLFGGFQNTFNYKSIELDVFFQFSKQAGSNFFMGNLPGASFTNQPTYVLNRWQKTGDDASIQRYFGAASATLSANRTAQQSDFAYGDASYIRLKNVSLSWRFPQTWIRKLHMQTARLYMLGQNLATITNYIGLDPETRNQKTLPPLRIITLGAQIGF